MEKFLLKLGLYDDPQEQSQEEYSIDLYESNLAIFGTASSGKTTLLKTLLVHLHNKAGKSDKKHVYILDFSNHLKSYADLPYVLAYFDASNEENVRRMFKILEEKLSENVKKLDGEHFVGFEATEKRPAHITFIIDGLNSFFSQSRFDKYHETLTKISREGKKNGLTIVFTANEPVGNISRLLFYFDRKIAFDLPKDRYFDLFSVRVDKPMVLERRGIANIGGNCYEFQGFLPFRSIKQGEERNGLKTLNEKMKALGVDFDSWNLMKKKSFVGNLDITTWSMYTNSPLEVKEGVLIAGLDYYTFDVYEIDLRATQTIAIYGNKESGKTNLLLRILIGTFRMPEVRLVFWNDKRGGLNEIFDALDKFDDIREQNSLSKIYKDINGEYIADKIKILSSQADFERYIREEGYFPELPSPPVSSSPYSATSYPSASVKKTNSEKPENKDSKEKGEKGDSEGHIKKLTPSIVIPEEPSSATINPVKDTPFTIFIIQSREFYQISAGQYKEHLVFRLMPFIREASGRNALFIFSDAQKISDNDIQKYFNSCLNHAFLMYDIFRFINERGKGTVFAAQELAELKENFGPCEEKGDGFYFNLETDELKKMKFIKVL